MRSFRLRSQDGNRSTIRSGPFMARNPSELAKSQNQTRIDTRQTLIGSNLPSRLYFLRVRERSEKQDRSYDPP